MTREVTRRDLLRLLGAGTAAAALSGCGGFSTARNEPPSGGGGPGGGASAASAASGTAGASGSTTGGGRVSFTTFASATELAAFQALAQEFQGRTGTTVDIRNVPYEEALKNVDAGLSSGNPPDLFRVTYNDIGIYSQQNALLDLGPTLGAGFRDQFIPGLWNAVSDGDKVHGVPHHTDTTMLLYNRGVMQKAGITEIPERYDDAWSWQEFVDVARRVKQSGGTRYAFGVNWQQFGAYRWMNFLAQAGGRLLGPDLKSPAVPSPESLTALRFTQSFFTEGLVPPNTSTKGAYVSEIFPDGRTMGMVFAGDFLLPDFEERIGKRFEYGATFVPRDRQAATDLGGNAIAVTAGGRNPEQGAAFAKFLVEEGPMRRYCEQTSVLPTRPALAAQHLDFKVRPDLMRLYVQQAGAILPELVDQVTIPQANALNNALVNRLEQAFVGKQDAQKVLDELAGDLRRVVR